MSGIKINSNTLSLNAQRRLGESTNALQNSFSRLSSGLRIVRASDDAAGLAISESLKTDARLASQALRNTNDGISMISIVSGALDAQKGILFRMAELAEQSANGTNSKTQRQALQKEYMQLQEEFDRVATSATFNGLSLLRNPDAETISLMAGITGAEESLLSVTAANSHRFAGTLKGQAQMGGGAPASWVGIFIAGIGNPEFGVGANYAIDVQDYASVKAIDSNQNSVTIKFAYWDVNFLGGARAIAKAFREGEESSSYNQSMATINSDKKLNFSFTNINDGASLSFSFDMSDFQIKNVDTGTSELFGENDLNSVIGFTNIEGQRSSKKAIEVIKNRISVVAQLQGEFGAVEARLQVAANRLQVDRENFQAAASQITDVDVATEAATLTRTQILQQAASAVLAQANQQPGLALQLLRST